MTLYITLPEEFHPDLLAAEMIDLTPQELDELHEWHRDQAIEADRLGYLEICSTHMRMMDLIHDMRTAPALV